MRMLKVGDQAPDFTLKNTEQEYVKLSELNKDSQVVVFFFPLAFTSVCTTELCTVRDDFSSYEALNAKVVGVSVDSPFTLASFKEQESYNFELLSDFNKEASTAYGAIYEELMGLKGVAKRSTFVIGKDGKVKFAEVLPSPGDLPNFEAVKEALASE